MPKLFEGLPFSLKMALIPDTSLFLFCLTLSSISAENNTTLEFSSFMKREANDTFDYIENLNLDIIDFYYTGETPAKSALRQGNDLNK